MFSLADSQRRALRLQVLKVGKAGPNCGARFTYQHYGIGRAPSTLSRSLIEHPRCWQALGFGETFAADPGRWLRERTDRDHFFVPSGHLAVLDALERFLIRRLDPLFEGRR